MSTNVRIKQKSLFKKKLEMKDIVALTGLAYGVIDDNYRLIRNEMAENTQRARSQSKDRGAR